MPFELKTNMKLAPVYRRNPLSAEAKDGFDEVFSKQVYIIHISMYMLI